MQYPALAHCLESLCRKRQAGMPVRLDGNLWEVPKSALDRVGILAVLHERGA